MVPYRRDSFSLHLTKTRFLYLLQRETYLSAVYLNIFAAKSHAVLCSHRVNSWRRESQANHPLRIFTGNDSKNIRTKLDEAERGTIKVREVEEKPRGRVAVRPEIRHTELAARYGTS